MSKRKSPFEAAKEKGKKAFLENKSVLDCPYKDTRTVRGSITFSRAFRTAWHDGFKEAQKEHDEAVAFMANKIPQMSPAEFDFERWRGDFFIGGSVALALGEGNVENLLIPYAIGWCYSKDCHMRPKTDSIAVMFNYNINGEDDIGWFHIAFWHVNQMKCRDKFENLDIPTSKNIMDYEVD